MSYRHIFFTNVVNLAAEKNMSHQDLASKAKLSTGVMSAITRGQGNPTLETMVAIANALDTPLSYLLTHHDLEKKDYRILDDQNLMANLPKNYEYVSAILPSYQAFLVKKWAKQALAELNKFPKL